MELRYCLVISEDTVVVPKSYAKPYTTLEILVCFIKFQWRSEPLVRVRKKQWGGGTVLSSKLQQRRVECKGLGMRAGQERSVAWRSLQGGGEN